MGWVEDVTAITESEYADIKDMFENATSATDITFDLTSIPENRISPVKEVEV